MLPSCLVAVIYQEKCGISFLITMAAALVIGIPLTVRKPKNKDFHSREGFASVALGWIVLSIVGAGTICDKRSDSKSGGSVV